MIEQTLSIGRREGFAVHQGVYVAVPGPNFETRAEYRMFRRIGGDAVGMSTVPEVLTAASLGMRVLALSMVTNVALPDAPRKVDPHEVVELAARAEPNLCKIVLGIAAHAKHDPQMHQASAEPPTPRCRTAAALLRTANPSEARQDSSSPIRRSVTQLLNCRVQFVAHGLDPSCDSADFGRATRCAKFLCHTVV